MRRELHLKIVANLWQAPTAISKALRNKVWADKHASAKLSCWVVSYRATEWPEIPFSPAGWPSSSLGCFCRGVMGGFHGQSPWLSLIRCDNLFGISINNIEFLESTAPIFGCQGKICFGHRTRLIQAQVVANPPEHSRLAAYFLLDRQGLSQRPGRT